jgi:hypothetical protein
VPDIPLSAVESINLYREVMPSFATVELIEEFSSCWHLPYLNMIFKISKQNTSDEKLYVVCSKIRIKGDGKCSNKYF